MIAQKRDVVGRMEGSCRRAAANRSPGTEGSYSWGGAASTIFWNDPREQLTALFLTQLLPSSTYPIRPRLQQLVAQALVD